MKTSDIKIGETYMFFATDSPARKHLEGCAFKVIEIKPVWRRSGRMSRKVKRFFNEDGIGARADELEEFNFESNEPNPRRFLNLFCNYKNVCNLDASNKLTTK